MYDFSINYLKSAEQWKIFLSFKNLFHYDAEVYPNRDVQICPMRVSRVRFYFVNTLKMERFCGK